jgi:hypothetical protein
MAHTEVSASVAGDLQVYKLEMRYPLDNKQPFRKTNNSSGKPHIEMSPVRAVGIYRTPGHLSTQELQAKAKAIADAVLALPKAKASLLKYELVRRLLVLSRIRR